MVDQGAAAGEVGGDAAQVFFGRDDLQPHDRLEKHGAGFLDGFAQGVRGGEAKSQVVGVDVVGRAVDQGDLQVDQGIAGPPSRLGLLAQARLDRRQELGGITPPLILVTKCSTGAPLGWVSGSRSIVTLA